MTKHLFHTSPLGPLTIPGVLGEVAPGEHFEAADTLAEKLLEQADVFHPIDYDDLKAEQLKQLAADRGIDQSGLKAKADFAAALTAADSARLAPDDTSTATESEGDSE